MRIKFTLLLLLVSIAFCNAQDFSNRGTDFWTCFAPHEPGSNAADKNLMTLYFTSDSVTTITVTIGGVAVPGSPVNLTPGIISTLDINVSARLASPEGVKIQKGVFIHSTKPIVAYQQLYGSSVAGATVLFPVNTLGRTYTSLNYKQISNESAARSFCVVVATEDNTTVQVNPSGITEGGVLVPNQFNSTTNQKTLNKGDCWLIQGRVVGSANSGNTDLTGTQIRSVSTSSGACKPIAVFCGSSKISITCSNSSASSDNLFQQALPKAAWGKRYISAPTAGTNYSFNVYRIMLDPDAGATTVKVNGVTLPSIVTGLGTATTPAGIGVNSVTLTNTANGTSYYEFVTGIPVNIEATNPVMVSQYITNKDDCGNNYSSKGDPDMIYLSPVEQTIDKITVTPIPTTDGTGVNYINVVIKTTDVANFTIKNQLGATLPVTFVAVPAYPTYSYARILLAGGYASTVYYKLSSTGVGFNAIAYGYDNSESYAYNAGTNVKNLNQYLVIENANYGTAAVTTVCKNTPTKLAVTLPFAATSLVWDFAGNINISPNTLVTAATPPVPDSSFVLDGKTLYVYKLNVFTTFTATGVYPIKLTAGNPSSDGCSLQEITFNITVVDGPSANFTYTHAGCASDAVAFNSTTSSDPQGRPITKWMWDFADANTDNTPNPSHTYASGSTYNVKLRIVNDYGCFADVTKSIVIPPSPAAPTVTTPVAYCQNNTASALTATGTNLLWYTVATGGVGSTTAPTPSTASVTSTDYYVSQTVSGCQGPRALITVNVNTVPAAPTVTTPVAYCQSATATASSLTATGSNLLWYTVATNGTGSSTAPTPSLLVVNTTDYYVSQTIGCEGPRALISVNINAVPTAPTVTTPIAYCQNSTASILSATGTNLLWYTVATNGTGSSSAPTPSTITVSNTNYYVSQTVNSCESPRANVVVNINAIPNAPVVTTPIAYCQNTTASTLSATGTNLLWYTVATNGTGSSSAPTPSTTAITTTNYYVSQTVNSCESPRANIVVNVNAIPAAPVATTPIAYCQNTTASILSATGTNLLWYTVATNGTGSLIAPTPLTTAVGTTNYYVSQTVTGCESPRANVVVNINAIPTAPVVTTPIAYCQNTTASTLSATGNNLLWYTVATNGTGSLIAPTPLTTAVGTTNYYVSQTVTGCESPRANIVININTTPAAPTVATPIAYCENAAASTLAAIGNNLLWYAVSTGGTGSNAAPIPPTNVANTTTYYVSQTVGCESPRAAIVVNVNAIPPAPVVTTAIAYCENAMASALNATGINLLWYNLATGGTGNSIAPTPSTATVGTTNYYVSQTKIGCESPRNLIAVIVNAIPVAPTVTSPIVYCENATASALTAGGNNLLWYTTVTGGTGNSVSPTPSTVSSSNYYVSQTVNSCESPRANIAININTNPAIPIITASGNTNFCAGDFVILTSNSSVNNQWYKDGVLINGEINTTYTANQTSTYSVIATNANNCSSSSNATIVTVSPNPTVSAGPDLYILEGDSALLHGSALGGSRFSYLWTTNIYLSNDTLASPWVINPLSDTYYTLKVTNENGCFATDNVNVKVLRDLIIPNVFSPNGDGINDKWVIPNLSDYFGCTVAIYSRSGQLIFNSIGYNNPWNGKYNGVAVPVGTYYYIINPKNGRKQKSGSLTVLR